MNGDVNHPEGRLICTATMVMQERNFAMRDEYGNEKQAAALNTSRQQGYTAANDVPMEAGKVLAIAGGAAGALAGLWVLLSEREKKEEPKTTLQQAKTLIEQAAARAREEGAKAEASLVSGVQGLSTDSRKKGKKSKRAASRSTSRFGKKAKSDTNETLDKIAQFLKEAREEAATMVASEADQVGTAAKRLREEAGKKAEGAKATSRSYSKQAKKGADNARGEVAGIAALLKTKARDAERTAEDYVASIVVPKVKDLGQETIGLIETGKGKSGELKKRAESDVLPEAKKRADELRKRAENDLLPEAKKRAEDIRKRAEQDLIPEAKKRAESLTHTVETQASDAAAKLAATAGTVEHQASAAGEAVKRGSRETRSLLLWISLAGVLIFTVFLDEEQQKRLKEIAVELFGEAKDMYSDMKGEDTFQS
jgi:hypothetical protein